MDQLFLVNRVENEGKQTTADEEQKKLNKILKKIEHKKKLKERKRLNIIHTLEKRQKKRERKSHLVTLPKDNLQDFIDKDDLLVENEPPSKRKKKKPQIAKDVIEGFTILHGDVGSKKNTVKRVLPKWLSHPTVVSADLQNLTTKVSAIKQLDASLRKQLKNNSVAYLFPIQAAVIPWLLHVNQHSDVVFPQDLCVSAPTGSGKTLAFVLPVIQTLMRTTVKRIRALVILPTQALADQIYKMFKIYTSETNLEVCLMTTVNSFETEQKILIDYNEAFGYYSKSDIVVCTAGRLVSHLKWTKGLNLRNLEFLIIDEADRVLESVQNDWLYHLDKHIYGVDGDNTTGTSAKILNLITLNSGQRPPQKLLFSATLSQDPEKLEKLSLFQPKLFTVVGDDDMRKDENNKENRNNANDDEIELDTFVGKYTTPKELTEKCIICSRELQPLALYKFIETEHLTKTLIFTHSIKSTHRLAILLRILFNKLKNVKEISSNLNPKMRQKLVEKFANGEIDILICTDSLARGIDLPGVQCVVSYSIPKYVKTYIHRSGRTARAGEHGLAVTVLHKNQIRHFNNILSQLKKSDIEKVEIPDESLEDLTDNYKRALVEFKKIVNLEQKCTAKKVMSVKKRTRLVKIMKKKS